jgi:hypothetical protein
MDTGVESDEETVSFITYYLIIYFYILERHLFHIMLY